MSIDSQVYRWKNLPRYVQRWALKMKASLARNYWGAARKVQVRVWSGMRREALWLLGWDCFARFIGGKRIGTKYRVQLIYRPCDPTTEVFDAANGFASC